LLTDCAASNIGGTIQQGSLSSMEDSSTTRKCAGRIAALEKLVKSTGIGSLGISHTRWATHGKVNDETRIRI